MAKLSIKAGTTSKVLYVFAQDSSVSTGAGLTGLAYNTASLVASYVRPGAARSEITLATQTTTGAFSSGGFVEVDATNMPGVYRFDIPNAAIAAGVGSVLVMLKGATNLAPIVLEIELTAIDNQDSVRAGMSALPNAAATWPGGLYTRGSGAGQINQPANGQIDVNAVKVGGTTQTARDLGAQLDAAVSTRLASASYTAPDNATIGAIAGYVDTEVAAIKAQTDKLTFTGTDVKATLDGESVAVGSLGADAITAATLAADAGAEIAAAVRLNLVTELARIDAAISSRGTGAALDAAGVRAAVGLAAANLDAQIAALNDLSTVDVTGAVLDAVIEGAYTLRQMMRLLAAVSLGKVSGAETASIKFRDTGDAKDRVTATVDGSGNRSAVVLDAS